MLRRILLSAILIVLVASVLRKKKPCINGTPEDTGHRTTDKIFFDGQRTSDNGHRKTADNGQRTVRATLVYIQLKCKRI
uniref:Secreted protein n=1 Tax=Caenorhabditis tropicalis TaxID=1561998 RepID=A0A1I7U2V6_9PELO